MQKLVFTNGGGQTIDLTSGNFGITNWEGLSGVGLNIQTQQVPFQDGGVFLDALMEQREISVTVAIQDNNDLSLRYELKRQLISALNPKLGEGVLVYTNDYLSRQIKAVPQLPIFENKNSNDAGTLKASVVFSCPSPYWEDLEDTVIGVLGFQAVENNGDVPCQVKIQLPSNIENPMIINQTNEKIISLQGSFANDVVINTNVGEKSINSQKFNVDIVLGQDIYDILYKDGYVYYAGRGILKENFLTGERKNLYIPHSCERIIYANNLYVIVGNNKISTSQDGEIWNVVLELGEYDILVDIIFGNNLFVAIGYNWETTSYGIMYTSQNGTEWTQVNIENFARPDGIAFGNNIFVIQGLTNLKSSDGINWVEFESFSGNRGRIKYINNKFYASGNTIMTSPDGNVWTQIYSSNISLRDICYTKETVIAVGNNGSIITSKDEINWYVQDEDTSENFTCVTPVENVTYVGGNRQSILYSSDNEEWFIKVKEWNFGILNDIAFGNNRFVAVGQNKIIVISFDGINWQEISKENSGSLNAITYAKGTFIAVGSNGVIKTSKDGVNWTTQQISTSSYGNINYVNGQFLIYTSNNKRMESLDGYAWTENTTTNYVKSLCYDGNKYIGVANNGFIATSLDGVSWTQITGLTSGINYSKIIYANHIFVASGYVYLGSDDIRGHEVIATSKDGQNWTLNILETVASVTNTDMEYGDGLFVIVCNGKSLSSLDGVNWNIQDSLAETNGIAFGLNKFISVRTSIGNIFIKYIENDISKLSSNSDMTFNLEKGTNVLYCNLTNQIILSYRQKYIGV